MNLQLNWNQYLELEKIAMGVFYPLDGFMNENDFNSCVYEFKLNDGRFFPLPVVLDVSYTQAKLINLVSEVGLFVGDVKVGSLFPETVFSPDKEATAKEIFQTADEQHPGVAFYYKQGPVFVGGKVTLINRLKSAFSNYEFTPNETKQYFKNAGWNSIAGFQTRNIPHRAHEYLQRIAMECCDGLLVQPIVGAKKLGDFTTEAVLRGYQVLIDEFYPKNKVLLATLSTTMRYAGPREALFHAIIRRNYGCTHFIVGRDHAGVGGYYAEYAAHELVDRFRNELGISILKLNGPYFCFLCDSISTSQSCKHKISNPNDIFEISGSYIRQQITCNKNIDHRFLRQEVVDSLKGIEVFIE